MIWIFFGLLIVGVAAWIVQPLSGASSQSGQTELQEARRQLQLMQAALADGRISPETAKQTQQALELRVLEILDRKTAPSICSGLADIPIRLVGAAFLAFASIGLYFLVGNPFYQAITVAEQEQQMRLDFERDVAALAAEIEADPESPVEAYVLLARGYMGLENYPAALETYDRALQISSDFQPLLDEVANAKAFIDEQALARNPAASAIQALPADQQDEMIRAMVDGLAARLQEQPVDPQGWQRLIRSRLVLQDYGLALEDLASARAALSGDADRLAEFETALRPLKAELEALLETQSGETGP